MALQDSDNFIIGRGTDSYKITYQDLKDDLNYVPLNLQVGKGSISPTVDLEEGDTLTGSATVTDALNPVVVHVWELDGVEAQRGSEATYVADAGSVRYRQEVTDDNNDSPVIGEWSNAVTVAEAYDPTKPNATMYGLRFDEERQTVMSSSLGKESVNCTFSMWVKETGDFLSNYLHTTVGADNTQYVLDTYGGSLTSRPIGSGPVTVSATLEANKWNHVVISKADRDITFYLNGENKGTAQADSAGLTYFDGINPVNLTGINGSPKYNILDGYLSDVYFVDGQALDCTVFGKFFEGKWGPLDSSDVLENIGYQEAPSDSAPNYDQNWSATVFADTGSVGNQGQGFDGDLSTYTFTTNNDGTLTFTPTTPIEDVTKVEVYRADTSNPDNTARINNAGDFISFPQVTWTTIYEGPATTLTSLQVAGNPSANALLSAVRVNGRILVDGPADNSKVWSQIVTTTTNTTLAQPIANAFDGDTSNGCSSTTTGIGAFIELDFGSNPLTDVTEFGIYGSSVNHLAIYFNDSPTNHPTNQPGADTGRLNALTPPETINKVKIQVASSTITANFTAIYKNEVILIDSPPAWNTSKVWSDDPYTVTGGADQEGWSRSFDGDLTTMSGTTQNGETATFTFAEGLSGELEMYTINQSYEQQLYVDGVKTGETTKDAGWFSFGDITGATTIGVGNETGSTTISAFRLDGVWLVNPGSIGKNGFHLPFNPEAASSPPTTWSDYASGDEMGGAPKEYAFDGILGTPGTGAGATFWQGSQPTQIEFPSPMSGRVRLFAGGGINIVVDDGDTFAPIENKLWDWNDYGDLGTFTKLQFFRSGAPAISGIEIDGVLLVDGEGYNSIGADASGQGNHFQDENFATGNTSEVWSSKVTLPASGIEGDNVLANGFDGNENTQFSCNNTTEPIILDGLSFTGVTSVGGKFSSSTTLTVKNGDDVVASGNAVNTLTFAPSDITSIEVLRSGARPGWFYIKVEDEILIDNSLQDTVYDTPMKNYAVLTSGSNGNLVATANGTNLSYTGNNGTEYYYEINGYGAIHHGGDTFSSTSGDTYNFGQQPFAAEFNAATVWSDTSNNLQINNGSAAGLFNGDTYGTPMNNVGLSAGNDQQYFSYGTGIPVTTDSVVYVYNNDGGSPQYKINGVVTTHTVIPGPTDDIKRAKLDVGAGTTSIQSISVNTSGNSTQCAIEIDGKVLVDSDNPIANRENTLYQTWEQYARTTLGYALDRIAKLEKLRLEDAETIANLRTMIDGALSRIASIESDEVNDDAVDNSLITLVGSLSSQITTWTQRIEQAETALSDVVNRVTTLEL